MFPIESKTEKNSVLNNNNECNASDIGRSLQFDYENKRFIFKDGVAEEIKGEKAVKQWLELMCRTLPNKYPIYADSGFGINTDEIIGYKALPKGFIYSELQREIKENVVLARCIKNIINFSAENVDGLLKIKFTAVLNNDEEVDIDV